MLENRIARQDFNAAPDAYFEDMAAQYEESRINTGFLCDFLIGLTGNTALYILKIA